MWLSLKAKRVNVKKDYNDFCYFSCGISAELKNDEIKKIVKFPKDWINMEKISSFLYYN